MLIVCTWCLCARGRTYHFQWICIILHYAAFYLHDKFLITGANGAQVELRAHSTKSHRWRVCAFVHACHEA